MVLITWNTYFLGAIVYSIWMRHHPHVQSGQSDVVLSVEIYSLVLGNLVILGLGFIVRRTARRKRSLPVA